MSSRRPSTIEEEDSSGLNSPAQLDGSTTQDGESSTHAVEFEDQEELRAREALPMWKRPTAWWLMALVPFNSVILSSTVGAQVELFTSLVCHAQRAGSINNFLDFQMSNSARTFGSCVTDPSVQAEVARLDTVLLTLIGILTFATAAWWGSFSDRHGRKRMLGIAALGHVVGALNIILVVNVADRIRGAYWLFVINSAVTGILGGSPSETASVNAYIADLTTPEKRSRIFSFVMGSSLLGIGVGPMLGSLILRTTHDPLFVFYLAAAFRIVTAFLIWFLLPESLTSARMHRASLKYQETLESARKRTGLARLKNLYFLVEPVTVLIPDKVPKGTKRDWNLFILAMSDGLMLLAGASGVNQFLYALRMFDWDAEYLNYCISSIGFARATFLILLLPLAIKLAMKHKAKDPLIPASPTEREPLLSSERNQEDTSSRASGSPSTPHLPRSSAFDLGLARFSILVNIVVFGALPFAPNGILFIVFISFSSLGAGFAPAINSAALEFYRRQGDEHRAAESGRLFGAFSVVQAVFGSILGPPLYGLIYSATVATHPRTVFFVALVNSALAFALLSSVRLRVERAVGTV